MAGVWHVLASCARWCLDAGAGGARSLPGSPAVPHPLTCSHLQSQCREGATCMHTTPCRQFNCCDVHCVVARFSAVHPQNAQALYCLGIRATLPSLAPVPLVSAGLPLGHAPLWG
jgi:hypothetical protein